MPYSTNPESLEKIRDTLSELEAGKPCQWRVPPAEAQRFAYKIRQALHIAATYPTRYPKLAEASRRFEIRVTPPYIKAIERYAATVATAAPEAPAPEPSDPAPDPAVPVIDVPVIPGRGIRAGTATHAESSAARTLAGPQTVFTIVAALRGFTSKVAFPDAKLSDTELSSLHRYCKLQQPPLMIVIPDESEPGLVIDLADPDMEEFEWKPGA